MSAQACLAGMFPPTSDQIFIENFYWHPIPVHTQPRQEDYTLATSKRCDRFDYVMIEYLKKVEYTGLFAKYSSLIQYLEVNTGQKLQTLSEIYDIYDTLTIQKLKGKQFVHKKLIGVWI